MVKIIKKYKIPKQYERIYGKGIIYCKIEDIIHTSTKETNNDIYKVRMLNKGNFINFFASYELKKLNLIDRFIVRKYI